jgi:Flp pilus assembly protein TadD
MTRDRAIERMRASDFEGALTLFEHLLASKPEDWETRSSYTTPRTRHSHPSRL